MVLSVYIISICVYPLYTVRYYILKQGLQELKKQAKVTLSASGQLHTE